MKTNTRTSTLSLLVFLLFICGTSLSYCQSNQANEDWWKPIVKKHNINYESYTVHGQFVIFGKKVTTNDLESFSDVTLISNGKNNYTIYTSKEALYDMKSTVLRIYDCTMKVYDWNSISIEPSNTYNHISFRVNFTKGFSHMADTIVR
jgi:hypothetical protein